MLSKVRMAPVQDPFKITDGQRDFAMQIYDKYHEIRYSHFKLTGLSLKLSKKDKQETETMYEIVSVSASLYWAERGKTSNHWVDVSTNAIAYLHSLGFKTNEDIQRYLDDRILP
jgi:hypothetical protein